MFNGYNWNGTTIEVREDRFATAPFRGGARGGFRGGFGAPRGAPAFGMRGGFRGGFAGGAASGMMGNGAAFSAPAPAPVAAPVEAAPAPPQSAGLTAFPAEPSQQIWVRNVSCLKLLNSNSRSSHGRPPTRTWSSCSKRSVTSLWPRCSSRASRARARALSSSQRRARPRKATSGSWDMSMAVVLLVSYQTPQSS